MTDEDKTTLAAIRERHRYSSPHIMQRQTWKDMDWLLAELDTAMAILAVHRLDDCEPIDGHWLVSVGATKDEHPVMWTFTREDSMPLGLWQVDDGWKVMLIHSHAHQSCIVRGLKARGDVRRLAAALGIKMKEPTDAALHRRPTGRDPRAAGEDHSG